MDSSISIIPRISRGKASGSDEAMNMTDEKVSPGMRGKSPLINTLGLPSNLKEHSSEESGYTFSSQYNISCIPEPGVSLEKESINHSGRPA